MTGSGPKNIRSYISGEVAARAQQADIVQQTLKPLWKQVVGDDIANHSCPVRIEGQSLLVQADSSLWSNQIRHRYADFVRQLQRFPDLRQIAELRVRVVPANQAPGPEKADHARPNLSSGASKMISGVAKDIDDDSLREALIRLSRPRKK